MDFASVEDRIKAEWNIVRAFIAVHPYVSLLIAAVVGNVIGVLFRV